jgi:hypothetical protein
MFTNSEIKKNDNFFTVNDEHALHFLTHTSILRAVKVDPEKILPP